MTHPSSKKIVEAKKACIGQIAIPYFVDKLENSLLQKWQNL